MASTPSTDSSFGTDVNKLVATGMRKDDAQREVLIAALAAGRTYADAGVLAGVSERTVRRRVSDPTFAADVAQRRSQYVLAVSGRLLKSADRAVDVILAALEDADGWSQRLKAAELLLTQLRRFTPDPQIEARLAGIEAMTEALRAKQVSQNG